MARLLTLRRNLARLLTRNEVDDNFVNVASDFSGAVDPASLTGAYVLSYMRWADMGSVVSSAAESCKVMLPTV